MCRFTKIGTLRHKASTRTLGDASCRFGAKSTLRTCTDHHFHASTTERRMGSVMRHVKELYELQALLLANIPLGMVSYGKGLDMMGKPALR
jgi:hypothetical protein